MLHLFISIICNQLGLVKTKFKVNCVEFKTRKFCIDWCKSVKNFDKVCGYCTVGYNMGRRGYFCSRTFQAQLRWYKMKFTEFSDWGESAAEHFKLERFQPGLNVGFFQKSKSIRKVKWISRGIYPLSQPSKVRWRDFWKRLSWNFFVEFF